MSIQHARASGEGVHALFQFGAMGSWNDGRLVAQFLSGRGGSETAFRVLLRRHGPMVLGVCRRVLGDDHAAEDAFQATFLVLVKKAGTLRDCSLLTKWLYGVALRVASKEKARGARRLAVERQTAGREAEPRNDPERSDLRSVVDEEILRLPERYRVPLVLCHLEGMRHDEVARRLGCPVGTIESRLSRARERLRYRLARRGFAPNAMLIGAALRPPGDPASALSVETVEATLRAALKLAFPRGVDAVGKAAPLSPLARVARLGPTFHVGVVASSLVACAGFVALGLKAGRSHGESTPPAVAAPTADRSAEIPAVVSRDLRGRDEAMLPLRSPSAVALPLSGIALDGRLDDWPEGLAKYPIRNQLLTHTGYRKTPWGTAADPDAYFQAGFDPVAGRIYLAVVVRDEDSVVLADPRRVDGNITVETDAVEVYLDGLYSERTIPWNTRPASDDWRDLFDASEMPALQYVAVPGDLPAYGDRWGGNPSLIYGRTPDAGTQMKFRREGDVTTYEWAIRVYDRYPGRPAVLSAGRRLGLDVAVVDKDSGPGLPAFITWGLPPTGGFKGCDAGSLGELILGREP